MAGLYREQLDELEAEVELLHLRNAAAAGGDDAATTSDTRGRMPPGARDLPMA